MNSPRKSQLSTIILFGGAGILAVMTLVSPPSLVLTPLLIGIIALGLSRCKMARRFPKIYTITILCGCWSLMLGAAMYAANTATTLVQRYKNIPVTLIRKSERSNTAHPYISGPDQPLGYRYSPAQIIHHMRWNRIGTSKKIIFSAHYTIDSQGNRRTCLGNDKKHPLGDKGTILFIGDSFTMGEGINDCETLPSLFSQLSNRHATNTAMQGYGTHQALKLLEDENLFRARSYNKKVDMIVYRMINEHLGRLLGKSPWDAFSPCYELNKFTQIADYRGPFIKCLGPGKIITLVAWTAANNLLQSNEPLTYKLGATALNIIHRENLEKPREENKQLFASMLRMMQRYSEKRGAKFLVIYEDMNPNCSPGKLSEDINMIFRQLRIPVIRASKLISKQSCLDGQFTIPGDGHPNKQHNRLFAEYLTRHYFSGPTKELTQAQ